MSRLNTGIGEIMWTKLCIFTLASVHGQRNDDVIGNDRQKNSICIVS